MRHHIGWLTILLLVPGGAHTAFAQQAGEAPPAPVAYPRPAYLDLPPPETPVPEWAFTRDPPETADLKRRPDDDVIRRYKGSKQAFSRTQVLDRYNVVDWHPEGHPPPPDVVMHGHRPQPASCAWCHMPNGVGMPENAPLAGLPVNYFIRQVHNYLNGSRRTVDLRMASFHGMAEVIGPKISEEDLRLAAEYYSALKIGKPYIKVIETRTVPKTESRMYTLRPVPGGGTEPIGNRIIEMPRDWERFEMLDSEVGYIAYVPPGSIRKGKALVTKGGNGRTVACITCHGLDLRGAGDIPPLAGRSPSNIVRQLYNFKLDARTGPDVQLMVPVAKTLTDEDIVNVTAYIVSRKP
jgi:cytochrome c553